MGWLESFATCWCLSFVGFSVIVPSFERDRAHHTEAPETRAFAPYDQRLFVFFSFSCFFC